MQDAAAQFLKDNSSAVMTAGGVVGTIATAVVSFRAGMKTERKIHDHQFTVTVEEEHELSLGDKAKLVAPQFIPPVLLGGVTVGSIIMSHRMSAAKAAALAAAYGVSQKQLDEYKAKVAEKLGVQKKEKLDSELAQERVQNNPPPGQIIIVGDEVLCYDMPTDRYFKSTMERIRRAENAANHQINHHGYCDASFFYDEMGLKPTTWSDNVGWSKPFNLDISTVMASDKEGNETGTPCITINFSELPYSDFVKGHSRY